MKKLTLLLIISILFLSNCSKEGINSEPKADFSFNIISQAPNYLVEFIDNSKNAETLTWDFGDGNTEEGKDPLHKFGKPGKYSVTLTVTKNGKSDKITKLVDLAGGGYQQVFVKSISIVKIPSKDGNGNNWDPSDDPDLYCKMQVFNGNFLLDTYSTRAVNATTYPITWKIEPSIDVQEIFKLYNFYVYDDDPPNSEALVGKITCSFSDFDTYPTTVEISDGQLILKLELAWF